MRYVVITVFLLLVFFSRVSGQEHRNSIGGRLGLSSGFTYQLMVDEFRGYKGMMSFRDGGIQITALLESCRPLYFNFSDRFYYYAGMGAHVGFTRWQPKHGIFVNPFMYYGGTGNFAPVIGLDAIIGLEYRLEKVPLTFAMDAKPFFEFFGQNIFRLSLFDIGFSLKFNF